LSALVLDASTILAAFDRDDRNHKAAGALLADSEVTLVTLDLARYEVANVAIRAWRDPGLVPRLLETIDQIAGDGGVLGSSTVLLGRAAELAEEHGVSVYDAAYVATTTEGERTLVSCDTQDLVSKGLANTPEEVRRIG
jgi:predicted nucleic acid-binding protein